MPENNFVVSKENVELLRRILTPGAHPEVSFDDDPFAMSLEAVSISKGSCKDAIKFMDSIFGHPNQWIDQSSVSEKFAKAVSHFERKRYAEGDTCPACRLAKLTFEKGHSQSREEPGQDDAVFCTECANTYEVDWKRQTLRELAKRIARTLFTSGDGEVANRLMMIRPNSKDPGGCGWSESAVADQVFAQLTVAESEK